MMRLFGALLALAVTACSPTKNCLDGTTWVGPWSDSGRVIGEHQFADGKVSLAGMVGTYECGKDGALYFGNGSVQFRATIKGDEIEVDQDGQKLMWAKKK